MTKYAVVVEYIGYYTIEIEAANMLEAVERAKEADEESLRVAAEKPWREAESPGSRSAVYSVTAVNS